MRAWRAFGIAAVVAVPLLAEPTPAGAALDPPCAASGTIAETGETYDAATTDEVEIPAQGDVAWEGSVPAGADERAIEGYVKLDLPAPLPDPKLGEWDGPSALYANSGEYSYDLPSVLEGFDIRVYGSHTEPDFTCRGEVTVRLAGGGLGNPLTLAAIALAVLSIVNVFLAVWVYA